MVGNQEAVDGGDALSASAKTLTTTTPSTDEQLAERMFQGDELAARELVERYRHPLFGLLYRFSRNAADAEELFQEAFLRVLKASNRFDPTRRFKPWLYTIALNLARDRASRRAHPASPELRAAEELPDVDRTEYEADWIRRADLLDALGRLSEAHREVVLLKYFEGREEAEIAEACTIPRGTVKSRLHHALIKLRENLTVTETRRETQSRTSTRNELGT